MTTNSTGRAGHDHHRVSASRAAFWTAVTTAVLAAVTLTMAITTPPRSGPYCRGACISYPYTSARAYVPRDYLWMYPATLLALLVVVLVAHLVDWVGPARPVLGRVVTSCAAIGVAALVVDYAIQLTVLQPALLRAETDGLSPWSQYNPYGVFIALETVGYTVLNVAFALLGVALHRLPMRLERGAGWVFLAGGLLTCSLLFAYSTIYRARLDYRFEVISILITCLVLIAAPAMLGIAWAGGRPAGQTTSGPVRDRTSPVVHLHTRRRG